MKKFFIAVAISLAPFLNVCADGVDFAPKGAITILFFKPDFNSQATQKQLFSLIPIKNIDLSKHPSKKSDKNSTLPHFQTLTLSFSNQRTNSFFIPKTPSILLTPSSYSDYCLFYNFFIQWQRLYGVEDYPRSKLV